MLNLVPRYIFLSKLSHHLALHTHIIWRIPMMRKRIVRHVPAVTGSQLTEKLTAITGTINSSLFSNEEENRLIIESAGRALTHEFDVLGSGYVKLEPMQWNKDLKTGFEWKNGVYYTKQRGQAGSKGSDVKMPWELSRCHHLLWLAGAYTLTGEEKYAEAVVGDIEDWIDKNPIFYSVNWTCSMDVAIRAINWMYALSMLGGSRLSDAFAAKVYTSLYQHGYFIYHHLEKSYPYSNNHYASDIVGLLYLGLLFKEETKGEWYDYAFREYCMETRNQVLPSGVHFEKSVSYHRLMTELMGSSYYLLKRVGETVPEDIVYRIKTMFAYVANYTKPSGLAPLIEDNDNGRLLPFVERNFREHGYLCDESLEMRIISSGQPRFEIKGTAGTKIYEDTGIAIIHSGEAYLFVTCSGRDKYPEQQKRKRVGCHMHNDLLSFELAVGTQDVFVDAGSYIYTSDVSKHNEFRSTRKHNTLVVDDEEQNELMPDNAFEVVRNSLVESFALSTEGDAATCRGGYRLINSGAKHGRQLQFVEDKLMIVDEVEKSGKWHTAKLFFHCAVGLLPHVDGNKICLSGGNSQYEMKVNTVNEVHIEVKDDTMSPSYGMLQPVKAIEVTVPFDEKTIITTSIEWTRSTELH